MSMWSERSLSNQQSSFYWMNIAISISHDLNLHKAESLAGHNPQAIRLRRRLWWCCVMRDSLIALGRCSTPQIKDIDLDVLQLDDFEDYLSARAPAAADVDEQAQQRKILAQLGVCRAKLSVHLNQALRLRYSHARGAAQIPDLISGPVEGGSKLIRQDHIHTTNRALAAWYKALPGTCRYRPTSFNTTATSAGHDPSSETVTSSSITVLRSFIHIQYHATISTLNRPSSILPCTCTSRKTPAPTPQHRESALDCQACSNPSEVANRKRMQDSANHIIQAAAELHRQGLDKLLPATSAVMIVQALLVHTMQSAAQNTGYRPNRDVLQSIHSLDEMRQRSVVSHVAARYLESGMAPKVTTGHSVGEVRGKAKNAPRTNQQRQSSSPERREQIENGEDQSPSIPTAHVVDASVTTSISPDPAVYTSECTNDNTAFTWDMEAFLAESDLGAWWKATDTSFPVEGLIPCDISQPQDMLKDVPMADWDIDHIDISWMAQSPGGDEPTPQDFSHYEAPQVIGGELDALLFS